MKHNPPLKFEEIEEMIGNPVYFENEWFLIRDAYISAEQKEDILTKQKEEVQALQEEYDSLKKKANRTEEEILKILEKQLADTLIVLNMKEKMSSKFVILVSSFGHQKRVNFDEGYFFANKEILEEKKNE